MRILLYRDYILVERYKFFDKNKCFVELSKKNPNNMYKVIEYYKELDSTQTVVKKLIKKNIEEGVVVVAEKQNKSYGRIRRVWDSNCGGLWFSILLRPTIRFSESSKLALLLGLTLNRVLEWKYNVYSEIKWPNDVLVYGKKIAGIIIETSTKHTINWVVAGVGINVNNDLPEYLLNSAISLKNILNVNIDRTYLLSEFLMEFENLYINFQINGFEQFLEEYNNKIAYRYRYVIVDNGHSTAVIGENCGINIDGMLVIKTKDKFECVTSGTVRLLQ
jgi:BirA family biotin operon repressor/biotin-[acetyl-CoA-carboxylase] ligase